MKNSLIIIAIICFAAKLNAQTSYLETIKVTDSIYVLKPKIDYLHGNGVAILGKDGVFFIDTYITPLYALEAIERLKKITKLPVKYVLNTHWHYDHCFGNYEFQQAFPGCKFIMHDSTDKYMRTQVTTVMENDFEETKKGVGVIENEINTRKAANGQPITDNMLAFWKWTLKEAKELVARYRPVKPVYADITFNDKLTMQWGSQKLELLHWGDGAHSEGDVAVWIPGKRILISGDIVVGPTPYETQPNAPGMLEAVKKVIDLNPSIIIPGHGVVLYDLSYVSLVKELFETYLKEAETAAKNNIPIKEAIASIKQDELDNKITGGDDLKKWALRSFFKSQLIIQVYRKLGALQKK